MLSLCIMHNAEIRPALSVRNYRSYLWPFSGGISM